MCPCCSEGLSRFPAARAARAFRAAGTGSRYTRSRLPVELAAALPMADPSAARREEARIKRLRPAAKRALVAEQHAATPAAG